MPYALGSCILKIVEKHFTHLTMHNNMYSIFSQFKQIHIVFERYSTVQSNIISMETFLKKAYFTHPNNSFSIIPFC